MKQYMVAALWAASALSPAFATDVGVSVSIGQPGFYGRIDIGNFPQPQVIYPQPVVIVPAPYAVVQRPIYLRVPPGHAKKWDKYCRNYSACGQPVYFVQDGWYNNVYAPTYQGQRGYENDDDRGKGHGKGKKKDKGNNDQ